MISGNAGEAANSLLAQPGPGPAWPNSETWPLPPFAAFRGVAPCRGVKNIKARRDLSLRAFMAA